MTLCPSVAGRVTSAVRDNHGCVRSAAGFDRAPIGQRLEGRRKCLGETFRWLISALKRSPQHMCSRSFPCRFAVAHRVAHAILIQEYPSALPFPTSAGSAEPLPPSVQSPEARCQGGCFGACSSRLRTCLRGSMLSAPYVFSSPCCTLPMVAHQRDSAHGRHLRRGVFLAIGKFPNTTVEISDFSPICSQAFL